jgi:hypothetical protein
MRLDRTTVCLGEGGRYAKQWMHDVPGNILIDFFYFEDFLHYEEKLWK